MACCVIFLQLLNNCKRRRNNMIKKISFSSNIVCCDINDEYIFAYHSLYGNGRIIEKQFYERLSQVKSNTIDELSKMGEEIDFEEFINLKFLRVDDISERTYLEKELIDRSNKLNTGCFFERLHLSTTNKCNMNCKYCFCNTFSYEGKDDIRFPQEKMSFEIAKKAMERSIEIIKKNKKNYLSVEFFGGEPFLNPELIKDVIEYFKNGEDYGINIEYGCTSNGAYIPDSILESLSKYNVRVAISLDYINKKTQEFRGDGTNNYKWSDLDNNIKKLIKNKVNVKFQSVLSEETWNKYSYDIIDYAHELNIKDIGLILSFDFEFFNKFSSEDIAKKVLDAFDYGRSKDVAIGGYWYQSFWGIVNPDLWEERRAWKSCPTIGRLLSVETNGDVYACKTTSIKLGNIDNFDEIFSNDSYKYYAMRAYSNSEQCIDCEFEGFCSGSCTGAIENKFKNIYAKDDGYCNAIKCIIKGLLQRHFIEVDTELKQL